MESVLLTNMVIVALARLLSTRISLVKVFFMSVVFAGQIPPSTSAILQQYNVLDQSTTCEDLCNFFGRHLYAILQHMLSTKFLFLEEKLFSSFSEDSSLRSLNILHSCSL